MASVKRARCPVCSWRGTLRRLPAHMSDRHPLDSKYYRHGLPPIGPDLRRDGHDGGLYPSSTGPPPRSNNHS